MISLNTGTIGVFTETVVLDPTDTNPSGYSAVQSDITLQVTGTIVAPPPPPPPPLPIGIAWGDVHLTTFDGLYYNFQAEGEFTLAKSTRSGDSYDVQIRTTPYGTGSSVSVIDEVAAALGNQSVTFAISRADTVWLNGTAQAMGVGSVLSINRRHGAGTVGQQLPGHLEHRRVAERQQRRHVSERQHLALRD